VGSSGAAWPASSDWRLARVPQAVALQRSVHPLSDRMASAKATIAMTVSEEGAASKVSAVADVELTGRAAQMGRGVVEDVAKKMIADMASCLELRFAQPDTPESPAPPPAAPVAEAKPIRAGSIFWTVLAGRIKALFRRR